MQLDRIDRKILNELYNDSRLSMRELSKRVNLSAPSVTERVRKLENEGVIQKYTIDINYKKAGLVLDCILEITLKNGDNSRLQQFIQSYPTASFCYRVTGSLCYIVKISVPSLVELEEFINDVLLYATTVSHIVLSEVSLTPNIEDAFSQQPN
ncbi:AsnC family transcriptional regulator [Bacillus manliponensis]|uniref:AsnC family transcriptional regulator n=1 Tax=Bacillus manliponensis TaxID=574376 RepID=A0A073KDN2_9BACI|nr:Lrp/AsnC family transcriptional regulator [Bacillus manliponensis]KEK20403.1 AsnC family transcriptional regulator [Bacillus manliponensis]